LENDKEVTYGTKQNHGEKSVVSRTLQNPRQCTCRGFVSFKKCCSYHRDYRRTVIGSLYKITSLGVLRKWWRQKKGCRGLKVSTNGAQSSASVFCLWKFSNDAKQHLLGRQKGLLHFSKSHQNFRLGATT